MAPPKADDKAAPNVAAKPARGLDGVQLDVRRKELLALYDKIEHTKRMGIVYTGNLIDQVKPGGKAERFGVQKGWKISFVNGEAF